MYRDFTGSKAVKIGMFFHNDYYPWTEVDADGVRCWLKGTIFYKNKLLQTEDAVRLLFSALESSRIDSEVLKTLLLTLNGNFALAMETSRYIFCTVDRVRSIPLFYAVSSEETLFSDDAKYLRDRLNPLLNEENCAELLITGFVTSSNTLFDGISQLQAGEYLIYDKTTGSLATQFYHRFWHGNYFSDSKEDLLNRLDETFVHVFQRLIASTKGRQIVVPLSGGVDSRIIVTMLKRLGVEDVICFTYGKKDNKQSEISRQLAETLGYQWYFVEYTNEKWFDCYHSDDMQRYLEYGGNLTSIPHIQDFFAVKELKEVGKIPDNAVFVPGHLGMIAGSRIPPSYDQPQACTFENFLNDSLKIYYSLWEWDEAEFGSLFKYRIRKSVGGISVHDNESCANVIELFEFNERQAKLILNSVRVYEFFGFQWQIPLCDTALIDFFLRVPIPYRMEKSLYKSYMIKTDSNRSDRNGFMPDSKSFLSKFPLLRRLGGKIYAFKRIHTVYDSHPLAWYGIVPKDSFSQIYSGTEHVNSFIGLFYINSICPTLLIDIVEKYLMDAKRVASAL